MSDKSPRIRRPATAAFSLVLALASLLIAAAAHAQGSVTVKVLRPDGTPGDFVDVTLEAISGSTTSPADLTDDAGIVRFVGVPAGTYKAQAFADGLVSDILDGIVVGPNTKHDLTINMRSAGVIEETQEFIIEVDLDPLDTKQVTTETLLTGEYISKVPLQNRRIEDIVALLPGVIRVGASDSTELSIGGGTGAQIGYRLDGQSANDAVDGGLALQVPSAAIASFKLITSGASARYGEQSTGVAEIVTKSGLNEPDFLYEMNYRDTDYGGFEISQLDAINQEVHEIITADNTLLEGEVRDGFRLLGVDTLSTTEDDNNPIPRRRIEQTVSAGGPMVRDKAFFHATLLNRADDYGSAFVDGVNQNDQIVFTSKLNWNVLNSADQTNQLEVTANVDVQDDAGFAALQATPSVNQLNTRGYWSLGATDRHIFPNSALLETKLQLNQSYETTRPEDVRAGVGTQFLIPLPPGGFTNYTLGNAATNFDETVTTLRLEAAYSKAIGRDSRHNIEFGMVADQVWFESFTENGDTATDLRIVDDSSGLGQPNPGLPVGRATTFGAPTRTDDSAWFTGVYVTDTWTVTDNFTLDMGLRAEYQSFVGDMLLAPRFGFSLDPIGDGLTRFFGNWGIYYDRVFLQALQFAQVPDRFTDDIYFAPGVTARRFSQIGIDEIYKESLAYDRPTTDPTAVAFQLHNVHQRFVMGDDLTAPTVRDWTIGVSRQIPGQIRVEVTYRANERDHLPRTNQVTRQVPTQSNQYEVRDVVYETTGSGNYRNWSVQVFRPFGKNWSTQLSYTQSKNTGPINRPLNPIDPNDVFFGQGTLGTDRTHVVKLQANTVIGPEKVKINAGTNFTWQSGLPYTPVIVTRAGQTIRPLGDNNVRFPSTRQLDFNLSREFQLKTKEGGGALPTIKVQANFFNLLDELNVTGGLGRFETTGSSTNPQSFPPLRPDLLVTDVDVGRSIELGFSVSF